ncbi:MAG: ABC transporter permease subunit [Pseudomonadota bacterium]
MGEVRAFDRLPASRYWVNRSTQWVVAAGGAAVIGAITLIFAYLLWVVAPILLPGSIDPQSDIALIERDPLLVDVSENGEAYLRLSSSGITEFYDVETQSPIAAFNLGLSLQTAQRIYPEVDQYALLDDQQRLLFLQTQYIVSFADGVRKLTPTLAFPFEKKPVSLGTTEGETIDVYDVHLNDDQMVIASAGNTTLRIQKYKNVEEGFALPEPQTVSLNLSKPLSHLLLGPRNQWVYLIDVDGFVEVVEIRTLGRPARLYKARLLNENETLTAAGAILGRYSLVIADDQGHLRQWGVLTSQAGMRFEMLRQFDLDNPVDQLIFEPRRKGFAALGTSGELTLLYPTSNRVIANADTSLAADMPMAISPRSNALIAASDRGRITTFGLDNKHPELSIKSLWGKVWYEGYDEPIFSWQSSSADNDFEPKFSLTPLAFGTLKAAFYALLFAVPIAVMGALYTAYFMSAAMRAWVKPGIEIMAALPTVILGFIGGLWLAPIIESNLSSVLSIFFFLPACLFLFALIWTRLPDKTTGIFQGWYALLVTPLIVLVVALAFAFGPSLEQQFFGGNSQAWFREVLGLNYDQRNALVVGIIMGLAVIPVIFTIAEDAIYGVPDHLIHGSLALGATPWQTLIRVVLLTASPGIFSAIMIGMGRAVGETMIVLMATGNTPLMDFNIFEGMRTFAANIAVELPESEVDSSHYRILFLAALVLFILTFLLNTIAEVVRQRLRARYGSL